MAKPSNKQNKQLKKKKIDNKGNNSQHINKFETMREKYKKIYFDIKKEEVCNQKKNSEEERKKIDLAIEKIEEILESIDGQTEHNKKVKAFSVFKLISEIKKYQYSIEQAEKMLLLLQAPQLKNIKLVNMDERNLYQTLFYTTKGAITKKLIQAIDFAQSETSDIEELKQLKQNISYNPFKRYEGLAEGVKNKINIKIRKNPQQEMLDKIKSEIPKNLLEVVRDLANGELDIESANSIINEEAKKRVKSRVKNKFTLTEEQERKQIIFQIKTALEERAEQYPVKNPEESISELYCLSNDSLEQSISCVVENLINNKSFETAKKVYEKFYLENQPKENSVSMVSIKNRIRNAEIGDMVLRGIQANRNDEQDEKNYKLIEKGLKTGNVNIRTISLGKTQSGVRNITLADIWPDREKEK